MKNASFFFSQWINRALDYPREKDGARVQMRLSYNPAAQFLLFLVQWTDCHLAGALGLLRVLIYMVHYLQLLASSSSTAFFITFSCDCLINSFNGIRPMRMGKPQCRFMREKPVLKISMVMHRFKCLVTSWLLSLMLMGFSVLWNSCDISIAFTTRKGYHRPGWPQTERGLQNTVQK